MLIFSFSLRCGLKAIVERNSTLALEVRPFFQAWECVSVFAELSSRREDHSPRWHYPSRNCSWAHVWKPSLLRMCWQCTIFRSSCIILWTFSFIISYSHWTFQKIIAIPNKLPFEYCVCVHRVCVCVVCTPLWILAGPTSAGRLRGWGCFHPMLHPYNLPVLR